MNRNIASCALLFLTLFVSCHDETKQDSKIQYFDLSSFVKKEAERLASKNQQVTKSVFLNGKEEEKTIVIADWEKELSALKEADINKKSFLGKYSEESLKEDTQLKTQYSAKEENLRTRALSVTYGNDGTPVKVNAVLNVNNILYSSHQQLNYERDRGFWISGKQTIRFLKPDTFSISIIFRP